MDGPVADNAAQHIQHSAMPGTPVFLGVRERTTERRVRKGGERCGMPNYCSDALTIDDTIGWEGGGGVQSKHTVITVCAGLLLL